jgi:hypothetical protein
LNHSATFQMPSRAAAFEAGLEGLTRVNEVVMRETAFPPLYESGVRYKTEPRDVWRHAGDVLGERWGDCEDLSAYRAAELRVSGEDPGARVTTYESGPHRYHAVVTRGDGTIEDPSRELGMGAKPMGREKQHASVIGEDPTPDEGGITFEVMKVPGKGWGGSSGWRGVIRLPLGMQMLPGKVEPAAAAMLTAGPLASTPQAAIKSAAASVVNNPSVQAAMAKELAAMIPGGQTAAAILANPVAKKVLSEGAHAAAAAIKSLKFW